MCSPYSCFPPQEYSPAGSWQLAGESKPAYHAHAHHPKVTAGVCSAAVAATGMVLSFAKRGHSLDVGMEGVSLLCNNGICDLGYFLMGAS